MNKVLLFWGVLVFILIVAFVVVKTQNPTPKDVSVQETQKAVAEAKALYRKALAAGTDMSTGPCLSNDLMNGWVVDVVHSPRQDIDNLPHYQCQAYLEGRAKHFVELDISGNLVRVR